jgi:hypoxanthine phosphoribosyltransferase
MNLTPKAIIKKIVKKHKLAARHYQYKEAGYLKMKKIFNSDADLTSELHWWVGQLYIYGFQGQMFCRAKILTNNETYEATKTMTVNVSKPRPAPSFSGAKVPKPVPMFTTIEGRVAVLEKSYNEIIDRIEVLALEIDTEYLGETPTFLALSTEALFFTSHLLQRSVSVCNFQMITIDTKTANVEGQDVVLLVNMLEHGKSLNETMRSLNLLGVKSITIAALFVKTKSLDRHCTADFVGFEVNSRHYVGFGMDYKGFGASLLGLYCCIN